MIISRTEQIATIWHNRVTTIEDLFMRSAQHRFPKLNMRALSE